MAEVTAKELSELLAGTWIGIACLVEVLVQRKIVPRSELASLLATSEAMATDQGRRSGIASVRHLIESALGCDPPIRGATPSGAVINAVGDEVAEARIALEASIRRASTAYYDAAMISTRNCPLADHPMVIGSDFHDIPISPEAIKRAG